jgi:uncharacterized protein (DUF433 family)
MFWNPFPAVERNSEVLSGTRVFAGTRVPIRALFENLRNGATIEQFGMVSRRFDR